MGYFSVVFIITLPGMTEDKCLFLLLYNELFDDEILFYFYWMQIMWLHLQHIIILLLGKINIDLYEQKKLFMVILLLGNFKKYRKNYIMI